MVVADTHEATAVAPEAEEVILLEADSFFVDLTAVPGQPWLAIAQGKNTRRNDNYTDRSARLAASGASRPKRPSTPSARSSGDHSA